ncbi:MAG: type IV pilin protein [Candidatus Binatia bacterium]
MGQGIKGFTLIEILVVVAIVGILSAIAIPQFSEYRRRAVDQHMVRDLENAAVAMEAYFADTYVYTSALADLTAIGLRQTPGVTLTITVTGSTYTMTASESGGTKASYSYDSATGAIN